MLIGLEGPHVFYVSLFGTVEHLRRQKEPETGNVADVPDTPGTL
jgi:hypothetical protein